MSLETAIASFDPTPFMRVGNPKRSSWTSGEEGALVFYYEAPTTGRTFLIRTQAPYIIEQLQLAFRTDRDGQFGDLTRRAIIAGLQAEGLPIADTESAGLRLLAPALVKAIFGGRGRVQFPARMEWPDPSHPVRASGRSTYLAAFDIATGRTVPFENVTAPASTAPTPATQPVATTAPPAPAPAGPTPAPTPTTPAAPPTGLQPTSYLLDPRTGASSTTAPTQPATTAPTQPATTAPDVYPPGQRPAAPPAPPPGYAYVQVPGGPTVLVPAAQILTLAQGQMPPPAPAGHQWTASIDGQAVLVSLAPTAPPGAAQGACPPSFVKGTGPGCKPTSAATLSPFSAPIPADPADMLPKAPAAYAGLASKDPSFTDAQRAKAKEYEVELFAYPEAQRDDGGARRPFVATAVLFIVGAAAAAAGGYAGGRSGADAPR